MNWILGLGILFILIGFFWLVAHQARKFGQEQEMGMHKGVRKNKDPTKGGIK